MVDSTAFKLHTRNQPAKILKFPNQKYTKETGKSPVQPLRSMEYIEKAKQYFLNKPERYKGQNIRDYTIFVLGINLARRCGDLLHFRIHNVWDGRAIKPYILISEQKTGKSAKMVVTPVVRDALESYILTLPYDLSMSDFLFPSRKKKDGKYAAMTVGNFYKKMQALKDELELIDPIGTHTMRKTWVYMLIKNNKDDSSVVAKASKVLGHNNIETTFAYAGFAQEEIDDTLFENQL